MRHDLKMELTGSNLVHWQLFASGSTQRRVTFREALLALAISALFVVSGARAQSVDGPTAAEYPAPDCQKPELKLIKPETERTGSGNLWMPNNARMLKFDDEVQAYYSCIHRYIDSANSEAKKVQDKANSDLKQITDNANATIKAIQDKIRQAANEANELAQAQAKASAEAKASR
ncbi:MAG: hypothetical protein ABSF96_01055 [Steroidobacteraceae bacterium]|jgi:ElaB/YqjD/DUF883 family membrane-anchored ribosome-binding protein